MNIMLEYQALISFKQDFFASALRLVILSRSITKSPSILNGYVRTTIITKKLCSQYRKKVIIFEFVHDNGTWELTDWRDHLQKKQRAQLDTKTRMLLQVDDVNDLPGIIVGAGKKYKTPHIFKLQIGEIIRLRPMVSVDPPDGITVLCRAREENWKLVPSNAPLLAEQRRQQIAADPNRRRVYARPA